MQSINAATVASTAGKRGVAKYFEDVKVASVGLGVIVTGQGTHTSDVAAISSGLIATCSLGMAGQIGAGALL